jgi:glucosamine-6-phosphate deaminase
LAKFPRFSLIEKISPNFFATSGEASIAVAKIIKEAVIKKNSKGETFVLGLATGSTPIGVYKELIRLYKNGELSFKNVVTFNLDEYFPIKNSDP